MLSFDNLIKNSIISNLLYQGLNYNFESLIPILFEVIWIYTYRRMEIERSSPCFTTSRGSKEYANTPMNPAMTPLFLEYI